MPTPEQQSELRALPQVEELLQHPVAQALAGALPRDFVTGLVRDAIGEARRRILDDGAQAPSVDELASGVLKHALQLEKPSLKPVVNASGVVMHTNLGRSVLADEAVTAIQNIAHRYSTLEYDCANMSRGDRHDHYERMLCTVTGAEAALAVNNNAAAVLLVLAEFSAGRSTIISSGELVEIGGSFRVPDIMALSGARTVEVGTTNKTHLSDYQAACDADTAMIMKVHQSNFRLSGFTEAVSTRELRTVADEVNAMRSASDQVIVYEDLGSGAIIPYSVSGIHERSAQEALGQGADLVSFSCDKLLGGPQAGAIVGRRELIDRLKSSPYARVMRLDKLSIAALEATLRLYLVEPEARVRIPTARMLTETAQDVLPRTLAIRDALKTRISPKDIETTIEEDVSSAGGGSLPMCDIPTHVVRVAFKRGSAQECERHLATRKSMPVITRIKGNCILLDGRTTFDGDAGEIAAAFKEYFDSLR